MTKDQPTDQGAYASYQRLHVWTHEFSNVIREIHHQASRPDPRKTFSARVNRRVAGRVGSGRVGSGRVGSGRVGSGRCRDGSTGFQMPRVGSGRIGSDRVRRLSNLTGPIGSGQHLFKYRGPGQGFWGFQSIAGRVGSGRVTRAEPSRAEPSREVIPDS